MNNNRFIGAGFALLSALCFSPPAAFGEALSSNDLRLLLSSPEDALDKKPCVTGKLPSGVDCRRASHHVYTNEEYHHAFSPYIADLSGGYIGVGSDQGLTFVARSQAQLAWLMDYDPVIVWINLIHRAFILESPSPKSFLNRWSTSEADISITLLRKAYATHGELKKIVATYRSYRAELQKFLRHAMTAKALHQAHWLRSDTLYARLRSQFSEGRIRILKGDLLKDKTMLGIAEVARKLNVPIRLLYLSNAEDYWRYTAQFRANIAALPFDQHSLVIRTRSRKDGNKLGRYKYAVQNAMHFQSRIPRKQYRGVWSMMKEKREVSSGVYTIGKVATRKSARPIEPEVDAKSAEKSSPP